ncbi:MAG: hypothetical protein CHACPFDD_01943 [Phycisphaerae bacterium]|nr:hypothetical protein [Phycisphaerae bacterium]
MKRPMLFSVVAAMACCAGCVAVSAKDINTGMRYQVVAAGEHIYVVDVRTQTAAPVTMVEELDFEDGCRGEVTTN